MWYIFRTLCGQLLDGQRVFGYERAPLQATRPILPCPSGLGFRLHKARNWLPSYTSDGYSPFPCTLRQQANDVVELRSRLQQPFREHYL
jgi:hypothetical protein